MYIKLRLNRWVSYFVVVLLILSSCFIMALNDEGSMFSLENRNAVETLNSSVDDGKVMLPIIMYHSILKDKSKHGAYVISPDALEDDLKYLKEQGYTAITINQLIAYTEGKGSLPEKPILLSFDDGYYNNYVYAYPLIQKYDAKMVLAIIGALSEAYSQSDEKNAYYTHVNWTEIKEMTDSGSVEIQNHSYDLHKNSGKRLGTKMNPSESFNQYKAMLVEDVSKNQSLIQINTGITPQCFVYPFGAYSDKEEEIIREMGFKSTLTCNEMINEISRNPECLFGLGRYLRSNDRSVKDILSVENPPIHR